MFARKLATIASIPKRETDRDRRRLVRDLRAAALNPGLDGREGTVGGGKVGNIAASGEIVDFMLMIGRNCRQHRVKFTVFIRVA